MRSELGPLDAAGRVPASQQTRIASFLLSAHGAQARNLAVALAGVQFTAWQVEFHSQFCHEAETLSLLTRVTSWVLDPMLAAFFWRWEMAWLPHPEAAASDLAQGLMIDAAAFGHALHTAIRPAVLLPQDAAPADPFVLALRRQEFDSGRVVQAQIRLLKDPSLAPWREAVTSAVERRHRQLRELWTELLASIDVG